MKKEVTPKHKWLRKKTSDKKKERTPKYMRLRKKTSAEKGGNSKT
jgi:hypothetical protein